MKRTRFISMAWLMVFAMVLVLSPFQALAEGENSEPETEQGDTVTPGDTQEEKQDTVTDQENGTEPEESTSPSSTPRVQTEGNAEEIKKELQGLKLGIQVTPQVNYDADGKASGVDVTGALVLSKNTFKTQLAKNPFLATWKFTVKDAEGKEVAQAEQQNLGLSATETLPVTDPGEYTVVIDWKGPIGMGKLHGEAPFTIEEVDEPGENPGDGEPNLPENLDVTVVPDIDEDGYYTGLVRVKGKIADAKKGDEAIGKWKFILRDTETGEVVDKVVKKNKKGIKKGAWLAAFESGTYEAKVVFNGTFNGEALKVEGSSEITLDIPEYVDFDHEVKYQFKNGKHLVTASILEGEHATGFWLIGLFDMEGNPVVEPVFADSHEGKTFSAEFKDKLKPGHYFVGVIFEGTVDGQPGGFIDDSVEFEVKDNGDCITKPGKDDGKKPVKPGEPKQVIDKIKNGGKMPKTATQYPLGMMIGGGVLLLGLGVLGFMRLRRNAA